MRADDLMALLDRVSRAKKLVDGHDVLRRTLADHGLDHVAYLGLNIPSQKRTRPLVAVTYSPEWQKHYEQSDYVSIDPVVRAGVGGILPVDWAGVNRSDPAVRRMFGEAQEFLVGRQGLTIPISGRHHEFGLFTVTSSVSDAEWAHLKPTFMRDLMLVAYHFHDWAIRAEHLDHHDFAGTLAPRQAECLRWYASGLTIESIGNKLGISERTVRFHLELARAKLEAASTTHAVAKALNLGLITVV